MGWKEELLLVGTIVFIGCVRRSCDGMYIVFICIPPDFADNLWQITISQSDLLCSHRINITFFVPIVNVTYRLIKADQAPKKKPKRFLFIVGLLFNVFTAASVFGLLFMTSLKLDAIKTQSELHDNIIWRRYHGIFILFYENQNILMLSLSILPFTLVS